MMILGLGEDNESIVNFALNFTSMYRNKLKKI